MTERVNVYASWPHYVEHTASIFAALPARRRGRYMVAGQREVDALRALGSKIRPVALEPAPGPVLIAAVGERRAVAAQGYKRIALIEHGAGQSYHGNRLSGESSSYAGGPDRGFYGLFLHPNERSAAWDRKRYPDARIEVVGSPVPESLPSRVGALGDVIAVTFHADMSVADETRWAFPWIRADLAELARWHTVIGTGHPRNFASLAAWYRSHGIEPVGDFREVCRRADVLMFDNTSAGFAFAATGRPVIVLNPPHYRRAVDHGLRFWEAASVGVQVDRRPDLPAAVRRALEDPDDVRDARETALGLVYTFRTGVAKRAAGVLADWAG